MKKLLSKYKTEYKKNSEEVITLDEYLKIVNQEGVVSSPAERMLKAIGEPKLVDTSKDATLGRIFGNKLLRQYETFKDFYGLEPVVDKIVSYFKHAAQGLEESRQVLYFLGPVGSAKSSLAEKLKELMEQQPIYILADENGVKSPINESPLGLFSVNDAEELGIDARYLKLNLSPWALKRLDEYDGDLSRFKVVKTHPSQLRQIALAKTEPGDENNQDISALVGKMDIRKLEHFSQNDPDAYSYSGGLCLANQGLLEFVEMFKSPLKVLHPLLTATQERNYKGTEAISALPFDGIVLAHSNESEWESFVSDKKNEAFLDRIFIVEVPYNLRVNEEVKIYKKLLDNSSLSKAPCAPDTLETLAKLCVVSRLDMPENSSLEAKMRAYNGENAKDKDTTAKSIQEYKDSASHQEGFKGISTRLAYKILSEVFNYDTQEIAADPVHLFAVLKDTIKRERFSDGVTSLYEKVINQFLMVEYYKTVTKHIQTAYLGSAHGEFGQNVFDRYVSYADYWCQGSDYRDPDTNEMYNIESLNQELEKIEKPARIVNPKDFRHEVVNFCLRYRAKNEGKNPSWNSYEKMRRVIEANMFKNTEELLPVITFMGGSKEDKAKHESFVESMMKLGYTERQVRRVVEWHQRISKS